MDNPAFTFVITCEFNQEKQEFQVWGTDEGNNIKSLMLVQTVEDVRNRLRDMIVDQMNKLANNSISLGANDPDELIIYDKDGNREE